MSHKAKYPEASSQISVFVLHSVLGLPALPEQHGAAMLLSATSHFLLCRESISPAFPGAETPVLHSQVTHPSLHPWCSVFPWGLGGKIVLISYGLHLFTCSVVCSPIYLCNKYIWPVTKEKYLCC